MRRHGKTFFLCLAADVIREVNMVRDMDGVSFARKAMLRCALGLKNGVWKISQLKPELQGRIPGINREFRRTMTSIVIIDSGRPVPGDSV